MATLRRIFEELRLWMKWLLRRHNAAAKASEPEERETGTPHPPSSDGAASPPGPPTDPTGTADEPRGRDAGTSHPPPSDGAASPPGPPTDPTGATDEPEGRQPGPSDPSPPEGHKRPRGIGGKRDNRGKSDAPGTREPLAAEPELACRLASDSQQWEIVLFDGGCAIQSVRQDDKLLTKVNGEWPLSSFAGSISVDVGDGKPYAFPLFDGQKPLIFNLGKDWSGAGRRRYRIASGHFIIIAPKDWERTGHVPVEPGACVDEGFRAHYFFRSRRDAIEAIGGFRDCGSLSTGSGIDLDGHRIFDDGDDGDLFGGEAPKLKNADEFGWARVGEERADGWKGENFKPSEKSLGDVLGDREGRFFIRVYDKIRTQLLDSVEFRYVRNLREIHVNEEIYNRNTVLAPSESGYAPTRVRFVGSDGALLSPILPSGAPHVETTKGGLIVGPRQDADRVVCELNAGDRSVVVVLDLPRIWWRLERKHGEPGEWLVGPVVMTRDEFRNRAFAGEAVHVLAPQRTGDAYVGFDDEANRKCPARRRESNTRKHITVNLEDFAYHRQIGERLHKDATLNLKLDETAIPLVRISADPVPEIVSFSCHPAAVTVGQQATLRWETRNTAPGDVMIDPEPGPFEACGRRDVSPSHSTTYVLRLAVPGIEDATMGARLRVLRRPPPGKESVARVKSAKGGWRSGKGFSRGEVDAANSTTATAVRMPVRVDRRRRSVHDVNVETIRRSVDA